MATLEKIRSKSAILFTVIIVALLAFILGDFLTSSRSLTGPGNTAAKVDGNKIDIQEFNRRVEQQREQMQQQGYTDVNLAQLQTQVLNSMVFEALVNNEMDALGITVTDAELSEAMTGANPLPTVVQAVQQMGAPTPAVFYDFAFNPGKNGVPADQAAQLQQLWINLEKSTEQQLRQQKLGNLFSGALTANRLDAKSYYDENATTATVVYTRKDFSSLNSDDFEVSKADIEKAYNADKKRYAIGEEQRPIDYIVVDIVPSADDLLAAQQEVESAIIALREQPGTEGVSGNLNFVVNRTAQPLNRLSAPVRNSIDSLRADGVRLLSFANNRYTIAKLVGVDQRVDSVEVEFVAIPGNAALRDSVVALLNAGQAPDSLVVKGILPAAPVTQSLSLLDPNVSQFSEPLSTHAAGSWFTPDTTDLSSQAIAFNIKSRKAPVSVYDVAEIVYNVDPSSTTVNRLRADLVKFLAENNTAALVAEKANTAGYHMFPGVVTESSLGIANYPETRGAAKWVMGAKKGQVSDVYGDEQSGRFIAVALKDIYDSGFVPASDPDLNRALKAKVLADKKAEKLLADYQGKANTVADYAKVMDAKVDTTSVTFGQRIVRGFPGGEFKLIGNVASAEPGKVNGPIATNNAVVVYEVINLDNTGREFDYDNDAMMFNQTQGAPALSRNIYGILLGNKKVTNNLQKFYQD